MSKKIKPITVDEWLDHNFKPKELPPNAFTFKQFMEKTKLKRTTAIARLSDLISSGKLRREQMIYDKALRNIYFIVDGKD